MPLKTPDIPSQLKVLEAALQRNEALWQIIGSLDEIGLPDCWLVAGAVAQTVPALCPFKRERSLVMAGRFVHAC
jgi:hypothetical protein